MDKPVEFLGKGKYGKCALMEDGSCMKFSLYTDNSMEHEYRTLKELEKFQCPHFLYSVKNMDIKSINDIYDDKENVITMNDMIEFLFMRPVMRYTSTMEKEYPSLRGYKSMINKGKSITLKIK